MDDKTYLRMVAKYYQCTEHLAKKMIESAELNHTKSELDSIVEEQFNKEIK